MFNKKPRLQTAEVFWLIKEVLLSVGYPPKIDNSKPLTEINPGSKMNAASRYFFPDIA